MYLLMTFFNYEGKQVFINFWKYVLEITLTPSRRVYYIFSGPPYGIIFSENSEKISSH